MKTTDEKSAEYKTVSISRTFDLPVSTVWKAWTEPENLKKWWGPNDYTCPFCEVDLRVGGKYLASMKSKKDGVEIFSTGTYKEIDENKKLAMTDSFSDEKGNIIDAPEGFPGNWPKELIITVELKEQDGKTHMHMTQEPMPAEMYEDCMKGWAECLDKLESNVK